MYREGMCAELTCLPQKLLRKLLPIRLAWPSLAHVKSATPRESSVSHPPPHGLMSPAGSMDPEM